MHSRTACRPAVVAASLIVAGLLAACSSSAPAGRVSPTTAAVPTTGHTHDHDHGSGAQEGPADRVFAVEIAGGTVVGGVARFEASLGELIEITIASDADDEVHLHAYDVAVEVEAGGQATLRVEATIPGVFEAELHDAGFRIFELQVS